MLDALTTVLWTLGVALVTGAGVGGLTAFGVQSLIHARQGRLPSLPSYVETIDDPPPAVRFFAAVHDLVMALTEAWNARLSRGDPGSVEERVDRPALVACCEAVRTEADALNDALRPWTALVDELAALDAALGALWSANHIPQYATNESFDITFVDGRPVTQASEVRVYVHTEHRFARQDGPLADAEVRLDALGEVHREAWTFDSGLSRRALDLGRLDEGQRSLAERLVRHNVLRTRDRLFRQQVEAVAAQWLRGTDFDDRLASIGGWVKAARTRARAAIDESHASGPEVTIRTWSADHPGPPACRHVDDAREVAAQAFDRWERLLALIDGCVAVANDVEAWAVDPSHIESDRQYLSRARDAYERAFPKSTLVIGLPADERWPGLAGIAAAFVTALIVFTTLSFA